MLGLCFRRLQLVVARHCCSIAAIDSVNLFHCSQKGPLFSSSFSSKAKSHDKDKDISFPVSYLINSLGFSPELAISVSKKCHWVHFNSPEKPDAVIKLLADYGLNDTQISEFVKKRPTLLTFDAENNLTPKLKFFSSIGISGTALARMLSAVPQVLTLSLESSLKPGYDFSTTLGIPKEKLPYFYKNFGRLFNVKELSNVVRNVSIIREHGVPESSSPQWVPHYAKALSFTSEKVRENVKKTISMEFDPKSPTFMRALYVISVTDASKWEQKMDFYKKWGWTEVDVLLAFRKSPLFLGLSEKNILKIDFYLNKMGLKPADVAGCPDLLTFSLEKRIIPRCSVFRVVQSKGLLVDEDFSILTMLQKNEKRFLERFVFKYEEEVPELLSISQGKMGLTDLGLELDGRGGVKHL